MTVGSDPVRLFVYATVLFMYGTNLNNLINETTEKFTELYNWCVHNYMIYISYTTGREYHRE